MTDIFNSDIYIFISWGYIFPTAIFAASLISNHTTGSHLAVEKQLCSVFPHLAGQVTHQDGHRITQCPRMLVGWGLCPE